MCLPFHLYACSKPSLFWFQVIKINWTFNLISKPCPFLCLLRVGNGQLISQGELEVFLHFPPDPNPLYPYLEDRKQRHKRRMVLFLYPVNQRGLKQWFSVLADGMEKEEGRFFRVSPDRHEGSFVVLLVTDSHSHP